jgi:peptidoglycan/xylan/chitin deacetylase (PgdA/CDA1 family)
MLGDPRQDRRHPVILLYHRVEDVQSDPWGLAVSRANFRDHMRILGAQGLALSLGELVDRLAAGRLPAGGVCVTFDDGYSDNLLNAKPVLEEYGVPATFFLTSGHLAGDRDFWWDALERPFFGAHRLPPTLELRTEHVSLTLDLGADAEYHPAAFTDHRRWRAWDRPPTRRHQAYHELWQALSKLPAPARERLVDTVRAWAGDSDATSSCRPLSSEQVRRLASGPLVEVGGHSVSHPSLPLLDLAEQAREILDNKTRLEELVDRPLRHFAYPHGHFDERTLALVKEAGFHSACTSAAAAVSPAADVHRLPRICAEDWTGEEFARRLGDRFADA